MISIYTVTLENADSIQDSVETCWSKCYPSLGKAKVAVLEDLGGFRDTLGEPVFIDTLPGFVKVKDNPIWILDDIGMTGLVWTIFETELQE